MGKFLSRGGLSLFEGHLLRAFGRWRNVNLRSQACPGEICRGYVAPEIGHGRGLYQIDGAAAKSSAGHARANQARLRNGNFHHQIEFPAADLIIVPETAMRFLQQWPEGT